MKIIKPLTLGILHQPYRFQGRHRLSIAALGFFALGRSDERFLVDNLQWPKVLPQLPAGLPLDHVLPKAHAEVMLCGAAHAPKPVESMQVRLQCGPVDKRLRVIGDRRWDRTWTRSICVHVPTPFTTMPLTLDRAYGGADHDNPLGCGHLPPLSWLQAQAGRMPNVEYADRPVTPGRSDQPYAGFAPQSLAHAERKRIASGTYDQRWLSEDFPGLPRDFDFSLYNLSPIDQQFHGRFAGGEAYRLEGLHPIEPVLAGSLPAMRARAFVLMQGQGADAAQDIALQCDTVWFFPEIAVGLMVYRGEAPVDDSDALDLDTLMVAYDPAAHPRGTAHYREVMALRRDPKTAAMHAFNESQLAPERSPQRQAERDAMRARQAQAAQAHRQALLDETMDEFWQRSGMAKPKDDQAAQAPAPLLPAVSVHAIEEGDFDLAELFARAQVLADEARRDGEAKLAALSAQLPVAPPTKENTIAEQIDAALARAAKPAYDLLTPAQQAPLPSELAHALALAEQAAPGAVDPVQLVETRAALARVPALQRAARAAAPLPTTLQAALPDPVAQALGAQLLAMHRAGESLAGRDFAGAWLRGADLRGADLREVQLERADLSGACLADAYLSAAALTAACLDHADLSGCRLQGANLCGSSARGASLVRANLTGARAFDACWPAADLRGAQLDDALLMRIDLSDAQLDDTHLTRTVLMQAKAPRSRWVGTRWSMCVAPSVDFGRACFDGATLSRSVLMDASMAGSSWQGATLDTVYAGGKSDWRDSRLSLLRANKCGWRDSALNGACLDGAVLASCDFGGADLSDASLRGAQLHRSLFMRTTLRGIDAANASFFQALCRKADFTDAGLEGAVLVQADMSEAAMQGARMAGARVDQPARLS
ncbi:MAG: DUF2169 domain-containing protein [Lysobacter sp.]|nr:DUF2169 domain-containing protein [Lysobacter sp.]